jgi:hypothetical protein
MSRCHRALEKHSSRRRKRADKNMLAHRTTRLRATVVIHH